MKRITSRKESRRSSVSKPSAPSGALQYFTYEDVSASNAPQVGNFPQHGDTVALGAAEQEIEIARSRASRRLSQAGEGREHEDIFANAPEEPLAPEGPSRRSRRESRRSSRRASRKPSFDAGLGPSSSRQSRGQSRAISPDRGLTNGVSHTHRESAISQGQSHVINEEPTSTPSQVAAAATSIPAAAAPSPVPRDMIDTPPTAAPTPPSAHNHSLSQVPTAEDNISRVQTRASSGLPSRQSTGPDLKKRTSIMTTGSTKSKSKRQSRRSSKPEPLKYFTYDDVAPANPPIFGQPPNPEDLQNNEKRERSVKGKERAFYEEDVVDGHRAQEDIPQVPELPQKLAHMDLSGTGLTRSSTKDTAGGRNTTKRQETQRASAPVGVATASTGPVRNANLAATHGLDFTDIPGMASGNRRAPAPPPPVNMTNKPLSKRPSRELKNGMSTEAAVPVAAAVAADTSAGAFATRRPNRAEQMPRPARGSSFQEHLPESLHQAGASPTNMTEEQSKVTVSPDPNQPSEPPVAKDPPKPTNILERTRQALGFSAPAPQPSETPTPLGPETSFVSAPSSPSNEINPFATPAVATATSQVNGHGKGVKAASVGPYIREERIVREVIAYDVSDPSKPIINVEVLSRRYFTQTEGGRYVDATEKEVPQNVLLASRS